MNTKSARPKWKLNCVCYQNNANKLYLALKFFTCFLSYYYDLFHLENLVLVKWIQCWLFLLLFWYIWMIWDNTVFIEETFPFWSTEVFQLLCFWVYHHISAPSEGSYQGKFLHHCVINYHRKGKQNHYM